MIRREMVSKYPGRCKRCGGGIAQGERIVWMRNGERRGRGSAYHVACEPSTTGQTGQHESTPPPPPPRTEPTASEPTTAPTTPTREVAPTAPTASGDPALDALAKALLPRLEALGIHAGPREQVVTTRVEVSVKRADGTTHTVADAHPQFPTLLAMVAAGQHVYAHGAPGAGKTHAAMQVAETLGRPFRYLSLSPQSMPSVLLGFMDAQGRYVRTGFREAYEHGGVFALDEVDNANGALLASLNSALANGIAEFPDGQVKYHPDCVIIATGNTVGFGPTLAFPERRPLDRAFRDRFVFLRWEYAPEHERTVARTLIDNADVSDAWAAWVHTVRDYAATNYPALTCSPRSIYAGVRLLSRLPVAEVAEATLFQGIEAGIREKILAACPLPSIKLESEAA